MKINERYENVDNYRFIEKGNKTMKPKYKKITMEDLFDDDTEIINDEEINEDLASDTVKATNLAFVSKSKTKDLPKTISDLKKKKISAIVVDNVNESEGGCGCGGGKKSINETIDVEKTKTGYIVLSKRLSNGDLFKRKYMDYSEKEAKSKFKKAFDIENKKTLKEGGCGCGGGKTLKEADIMGRRSLPGIGGAAPGIGMYSKTSKENGKINKAAYDESMGKVSKYNDIKLKPQLVDDGGTAKISVGDDNTKKYGVENDEAYIEELAKSGMNNLDLDYDKNPSDKFKERVKKSLDGDESITMKIANKRKELQNKQSVYHTYYKDPKPMGKLVNNFKAFGKNKNVENESILSIVDRIISEAIKMKEGSDIDRYRDYTFHIDGKMVSPKLIHYKGDIIAVLNGKYYSLSEPDFNLANPSGGIIELTPLNSIKRNVKMEEGKKSKPDFLDLDKDGNKKESMKKASKDAKKGNKKSGKVIKKKDMKESEGWVTILDNNDMKEINSTPQPKVERPSADMKISTGFAPINLGSLRVENAENLDKVIIPEDYKIEDHIFDIYDDNRTVKVRFEEGNLIVLSDKNKKMINEESSRIMKLMNYNYNTKPAAKSVTKEDVNATLKKMINEVKGLTKGE